MSSRGLFASILMACLFTVGPVGSEHVASAASAKQMKPAKNYAKRLKRRDHGPLLYLPIAPSYLAYDYPYYYSRGFYPTHIGPGYIYYGIPYHYYRSRFYPRYGG